VKANRTITLANRGRIQSPRPSADWLVVTVAASYADSAIAVVLRGYQRDDARGMMRIRQAGGVTIVQDPETADAQDMPNAAIRTGSVAWILRPQRIADAVMDCLQTLDLARFARQFDQPFGAPT
jgi:chemotaxis response regulator CheB